MEKSLILSLNFLLISTPSFSQRKKDRLLNCDCSNKITQDSLITRFIDNGAQKVSYNGLEWEKYCDSLILICPNIAIAYQQKAIPYIKNADYAKAFNLEDKAVELDPKNYTAYRGFLKCIFTKDYVGAIQDFQTAEKLIPNGYEMDHTYHFYEGLCNLELKNYLTARENFNDDCTIQTSGDTAKSVHFNSLLYIGILYFEMVDNLNAKKYFLKCLNMYKELPDANYYLALTYKREGNLKQAKMHLEIAKKFISMGYGTNEDNVIYAYYPHQITLYEIDVEIDNLK